MQPRPERSGARASLPARWVRVSQRRPSLSPARAPLAGTRCAHVPAPMRGMERQAGVTMDACSCALPALGTECVSMCVCGRAHQLVASGLVCVHSCGSSVACSSRCMDGHGRTQAAVLRSGRRERETRASQVPRRETPSGACSLLTAHGCAEHTHGSWELC